MFFLVEKEPPVSFIIHNPQKIIKKNTHCIPEATPSYATSVLYFFVGTANIVIIFSE